MKNTILIIEDDLILRESISDYLTDEGYNVLTAIDGAEGIQKTFEAFPDLILCDISMPKFNGYDVYKIVQGNKDTQLIPFIFITALVEKEDVRAGMQLGADDYITKPVDMDELLTTISIRLEKYRKFQNIARENYKVFFETSLIGIFIFQNRRIVYCNSKFQKITGYSLQDLWQMNLLNIIVQDDKKKVVKKINACFRGINNTISICFRMITGKKQIITLSMYAGLVNFEGQKALVGNILECDDAETAYNKNIDIQQDMIQQLEDAIRTIEHNNEYITPELLKKIMEIYRKNKTKFCMISNPDNLTDREIEVLRLICKGKSTQEIAGILNLSKRTIDSYRTSLYSKTGVENIVSLIIYAIKHNIAEMPD